MTWYSARFLPLALLWLTLSCNSGSSPAPAPPTPPPPTTPTATTFTNPLLGVGPDPWVYRKDNMYYYMSTTGGNIESSTLSNISINNLYQRRGEIAGDLGKLRADFGPDYPQVIALQSQINELDRQIARERARISSSVSRSLGDKYREALALERKLEGQVGSLKGDVLDDCLQSCARGRRNTVYCSTWKRVYGEC